MRYFFSLFLSCIIFIHGGGVFSSAAENHIGALQAQMQTLFESENEAISLGAMLLSTNIQDSGPLEIYIRSTIKNDNTWQDAIKKFTVSRYTFSDEDALVFIESIPTDEKGFKALVDFECSTTRYPPSYIFNYLLQLGGSSYPHNVAEAANKKVKLIYSLSDGWLADFLNPDKKLQK